MTVHTMDIPVSHGSELEQSVTFNWPEMIWNTITCSSFLRKIQHSSTQYINRFALPTKLESSIHDRLNINIITIFLLWQLAIGIGPGDVL